MRRMGVTFGVLAAMLFFGAPAAGDTIPDGGGGNNVVLVRTSENDSWRARASTHISRVGGPTVASSNIAVATSIGCTGCYSTAVAVQIVLVMSDPQFVVPANVATAVNAGCSSCGSFAYAKQLV